MDIQLAKCGTLVLMCNHQPATILTIWPHTHVAPPAANRPFQLAGSTCSSLYSNTSGRLRLTFRLSNRHAKTARWHWFALRKGCGRALALTFSRLPGTPHPLWPQDHFRRSAGFTRLTLGLPRPSSDPPSDFLLTEAGPASAKGLLVNSIYKGM